MTKPPNMVQGNESEFYPNAWERFEYAVDVVIKSGPKHRQALPAKPRERPTSKGRVHKGSELKLATVQSPSDFHVGLWMAVN
jgi:hypothetical protein